MVIQIGIRYWLDFVYYLVEISSVAEEENKEENIAFLSRIY